jgi:hypothetical protein
VNQPLLP